MAVDEEVQVIFSREVTKGSLAKQTFVVLNQLVGAQVPDFQRTVDS